MAAAASADRPVGPTVVAQLPECVRSKSCRPNIVVLVIHSDRDTNQRQSCVLPLSPGERNGHLDDPLGEPGRRVRQVPTNVLRRLCLIVGRVGAVPTMPRVPRPVLANTASDTWDDP